MQKIINANHAASLEIAARIFAKVNYKDIFKIDPMMADDVDFINYSKDGHSKKKYGFNNIVTVRKKVAKNKELMLPGIMFWQLDGDLPSNHRRSLLRAIDNELKK